MAPKLIDKEQAYQVLSEYYHHTAAIQHKALREALDRVPVIDDGDYQRNDNHGELIRCKDCKWHLPKYPGERPTCLIYVGDWHDYDYCSRAERKENDTD